MKVPFSWLKEFVDVAVSPRQLGDDLTLAGLAIEGIETHGGETVLDLDITTNRVDCMNVRGVAREAAVIYGLPLRAPDVSFTEKGEPASRALAVAIEAGELCPRFCARVADVRMGPSPDWMRERLEQVGVRPISNVVDLTNYVMLELGQPSHAFDLAKIPGGALVVRLSREGERLVTLDGNERALPAGTGVVAGSAVPLALAGVMGGASSEVGDGTSAVAFEAAYWNPLRIRRAAKALGMHTEASHRFERQSDPEVMPLALARIAHLLERIGGGSVRPGLIDVVAQARKPVRIAVRPARVDALLGTPVPAERQAAILAGLGFADAGGGAWEVPSWRGDVSREIDAVEEVGRHHGLGRIPSTVPAARRVGALSRAQRRERSLRTVLAGIGLFETISQSLAPESAGARVPLANPLAGGQGALRDGLVFPGLLDALAVNLRQGRRDVALFEIGKVFAADGTGVRETAHLGLLWCGAAAPPHWSRKDRPADFFDGKGAVLRACAALGADEVAFAASARPDLHPGRCVDVSVHGQVVGWLGVLHPDRAEALGARHEVVIAELALGMVGALPGLGLRVRALDRFPGVARDLSVVTDVTVPATALMALAREAAGPLLRETTLADRYEGAPLPAGRVSLTLSLRFQAPERTLLGDEVDRAMQDVAARLRAAGHEIRGE
jgi:phenylalanyl-tRNA synthetase beta chain